MLHLVDILRGSILRFDPRSGASRPRALDQLVGAIALRRDGGHRRSRTTVVLLDEVERAGRRRDPDSDGIRFNDGACDPQGRFGRGRWR
jgi:sugar lactone lactonase YvrE